MPLELQHILFIDGSYFTSTYEQLLEFGCSLWGFSSW